MKPKILCNSNVKVSFGEPNHKQVDDEKRLQESILPFQQEQFDWRHVNDWMEFETARREEPHREQLERLLNGVVDGNEELLLCHSSDIIGYVAREIVSLSRDEPGGLATCRVRLNVIMRGCRAASDIAKDLSSKKEVPFTRLGAAMINSGSVVATSEVDVYLLASHSMLARFQAIITSLSNKQGKSSKLKKLSLFPEFILEKQKLFRSNSTEPVVVLKTLSN